MISQIHKEKPVRALLAMLLIMPITMSSVVAGEKMSMDFTLNEEGEWCGEFYANRWSNKMKYQCKTQEEWERLGVNFPEETPQFEKVLIGEPILGDNVFIRG